MIHCVGSWQKPQSREAHCSITVSNEVVLTFTTHSFKTENQSLLIIAIMARTKIPRIKSPQPQYLDRVLENHTPKQIRSMPPDITVVVGKDDMEQEFQCYQAILSFASPYLDAMLSSNMVEKNNSRIEFPEKDPKEWQIFYAIIACDEDFTINEENARMLTPWFHEFQMKKYLEECDDVLKEEVKFQAGKQDECIFPFTGKRAPKL